MHMAKSKSAESVLAMFKDKDVKYVDLRFTDPRGKRQHPTMDVSLINEDAFADGGMFDAASAAGWAPAHRTPMRRRYHGRRLVDRGLEGDQRVRHGPHARPRFRRRRPVL